MNKINFLIVLGIGTTLVCSQRRGHRCAPAIPGEVKLRELTQEEKDVRDARREAERLSRQSALQAQSRDRRHD